MIKGNSLFTHLYEHVPVSKYGDDLEINSISVLGHGMILDTGKMINVFCRYV